MKTIGTLGSGLSGNRGRSPNGSDAASSNAPGSRRGSFAAPGVSPLIKPKPTRRGSHDGISKITSGMSPLNLGAGHASPRKSDAGSERRRALTTDQRRGSVRQTSPPNGPPAKRPSLVHNRQSPEAASSLQSRRKRSLEDNRAYTHKLIN